MKALAPASRRHWRRSWLACTALALASTGAFAQSPHARLAPDERMRLRQELRAQGLSERAFRARPMQPYGYVPGASGFAPGRPHAYSPVMPPGHPPPGFAGGPPPMGAPGVAPSDPQRMSDPWRRGGAGGPRPPGAGGPSPGAPGPAFGAAPGYDGNGRGGEPRMSPEERQQLRLMLRERREAALRGGFAPPGPPGSPGGPPPGAAPPPPPGLPPVPAQ